MKETYRCQICKRIFVYAENSQMSFYDWISMLVAHVQAHLDITFANIEKEFIRICQEKDKNANT